MSLVLAIEPDLRQAAILQRVIQEKVHADVVVVDSRDAAIAAVDAQIPDVLLLSALLSPRDEDELIAHLRGLGADAEHLQTHTIPQLASSAGKAARGKGLLSAFRRKKDVEQAAGCDPDLFADEVRSFLKRAAEMKAEAVAELQSRVHQLEYKVQSQTPLPSAARTAASAPAEAAAADASSAGGSAWDSPFEWRRATPPARVGSEEPAGPPPIEEEEPAAAAVLMPEAAAEAAAAPVEAAPLEAIPVEAAALETLSLDTAPLEDVPLVEPVRYMDDSPEPTPEEHVEELAADPPALEEVALAAAPAEEPAAVALPDPEPEIAAAAPEIFIVADEPLPEPEPVAEEPAPKRRRKSSSKRGGAGVVRLTPLAMWARSEGGATTAAKAPADAPDRTTADELRDLMAGLSIPPHVAAVSYARGCRIRRVRVPAGTRTDGGDAPGPVILSKRALSERRAGSAR